MKSNRRRDRLSELPDSLILEILSRLQMRGAVQTTILSKRWKDLWTTVPSLDFGSESRSFIDAALAKWKGEKIKKFVLGFEDINRIPATDSIDSWLHIPIAKQVEDFTLCIGCDPAYCPPQPLYSCSSLTALSIVYCNLKIDENVKVQWDQLKSLTVHYVYHLTGDVMNRFFCGAPLLEEFILLSCEMSENLNIRSTSLKKLKICDNDCCFMPEEGIMLRICAPNLLSLEISACVYGTCLLDAPSLTDAIIRFREDDYMIGRKTGRNLPPLQMFDQLFRSLCLVEKLTLSDLSIQILLEMKENDMVVQFSNAKFLKLSVYSAEAEGLLDVLGMFPELMNLVVEPDEDYRLNRLNMETGPQVAMVDASDMSLPKPSLLQLKTVEITWSKLAAVIIPVVEILLENAHVLEKMVLRLRDQDRKIFTLAKKKVLSMPRSSPTAKVIIRKT